jgi:hypothetical protein
VARGRELGHLGSGLQRHGPGADDEQHCDAHQAVLCVHNCRRKSALTTLDGLVNLAC